MLQSATLFANRTTPILILRQPRDYSRIERSARLLLPEYISIHVILSIREQLLKFSDCILVSRCPVHHDHLTRKASTLREAVVLMALSHDLLHHPRGRPGEPRMSRVASTQPGYSSQRCPSDRERDVVSDSAGGGCHLGLHWLWLGRWSQPWLVPATTVRRMTSTSQS